MRSPFAGARNIQRSLLIAAATIFVVACNRGAAPAGHGQSAASAAEDNSSALPDPYSWGYVDDTDRLTHAMTHIACASSTDVVQSGAGPSSVSICVDVQESGGPVALEFTAHPAALTCAGEVCYFRVTLDHGKPWDVYAERTGSSTAKTITDVGGLVRQMASARQMLVEGAYDGSDRPQISSFQMGALDLAKLHEPPAPAAAAEGANTTTEAASVAHNEIDSSSKK